MSVIRDFFRPASSMRAFHAGLQLEQAGIPTPRVLAAGIVRVLHKPITGYFIAEEIPSALSLAEYVRRPVNPPRRMVHGLADAIGRLHQRGFQHGDLTINNILFDAEGRPWFVDLDRVRRSGRPLSWNATIEDFHRLAKHVRKFQPPIQRAALRLLKVYCVCRGWEGREREFVSAVFRRRDAKR